jgi:hypothetical protein|nr:MAG TPA: hypothetical protein [Bacteriophage sp.]DAV91397.1 MAG TPA: hypothetical protein [Bacteriophage sp.]DAZ42947.1 MAG TPA: hypothetical protein [Caudoviricetes sp.]
MKQKINIDDLLIEYNFEIDTFTEMDDRLLAIYPK